MESITKRKCISVATFFQDETLYDENISDHYLIDTPFDEATSNHYLNEEQCITYNDDYYVFSETNRNRFLSLDSNESSTISADSSVFNTLTCATSSDELFYLDDPIGLDEPVLYAPISMVKNNNEKESKKRLYSHSFKFWPKKKNGYRQYICNIHSSGSDENEKNVESDLNNNPNDIIKEEIMEEFFIEKKESEQQFEPDFFTTLEESKESTKDTQGIK